MVRNMEISVVIPTHNRNDLLERAVQSVIAQTLLPFEIIVVDDLPTIETKDIIEAFDAKGDVHCRYFENREICGALGSRNLGVRHAMGSHLAFLDDDDYWDKEYLKTATSVIQSTGAEVTLTARTMCYASGRRKPGKVPPDSYCKKDFYLKNPGASCSNFIVRKDRFLEVGGYDLRVSGSADKDIFMQLMDLGCSYVPIKERLVFKWEGHEDQWSTNARRVLPDVIKFYRKYWDEMDIIIHLKMLKKILRLALQAAQARS